MLDRLVAVLDNGCDSEAIVLAKQFASRPYVFASILAKMMLANRDGLIPFVLTSIKDDDRLLSCRSNGRTLLHHAAGASCLPVVQMLLSLGVDPDVLDGGNHTPLYRVAASRNSKSGPAIVDALVRAGANVDHRGGVNKSTPLHEASRHGGPDVTLALVKAGASLTVRDIEGFTPMERAIRCRRPEIAELLRLHIAIQ